MTTNAQTKITAIRAATRPGVDARLPATDRLSRSGAEWPCWTSAWISCKRHPSRSLGDESISRSLWSSARAPLWGGPDEAHVGCALLVSRPIGLFGADEASLRVEASGKSIRDEGP